MLAQFRAATEKHFPGSIFSVPYAVCCLAVLVSPTDWQKDKSYTTWMSVKKGLWDLFIYLFIYLPFLTSLAGVPLPAHRAAFVRGILYGSPRKGLSGWALSSIVCTCV